MSRSLLIVAAALAATSCASSKPLTLDESDAALKKCFETYTNFPLMRNECINRVRTTETDPEPAPSAPPAADPVADPAKPAE